MLPAHAGVVWLDLALALPALAAALAVRPWRALPTVSPPPWPWLAWCAVLPLPWAADLLGANPLVPVLSGACLLMLMTGWPLAVLALAPVAAVAALLAELAPAAALHRYVWLGLVPATLALALGAAIRRWLPRHLFVYILGRGFFATALATTLAGCAAVALQPVPEGMERADLLLARGMMASGDAFIAGMIVAIFVALRPGWLATYSDRLYLPAGIEPAGAAQPGPGSGHGRG